MKNKYDICKKYPVGEFDVTGEWIAKSSDINFTFEDDWTIHNLFEDKIYNLNEEYLKLKKDAEIKPELKSVVDNLKYKLNRYIAIEAKMMKFFYLLNCEEKLYSYKENQI